ncbi:MAG: histidine phosphatase family protein [Bacillota bacterium]|nr:histidine phosphatase family protein [Bacillota bacterium]
MNTEVLLVRHGVTKWNTDGKFLGSTDIELSNEGILQAKLVKERLNGNFDCLYTSPLKRAFETSKIILENTSMAPNIADDLREINFGEWEGLTLSQVKSRYDEELYNYMNDEVNANLVGGDLSLRNAALRAKNEITGIAKQNMGKRIIIVAHEGILKSGLIGIFNWKMTMFHKLILGNTSISKISFDENFNSMLISLNDTNHLGIDYKYV